MENTDDQETGPAFPTDIEHPICIIDQLITVTMEILEHYEAVGQVDTGRSPFLKKWAWRITRVARLTCTPAPTLTCQSKPNSTFEPLWEAFLRHALPAYHTKRVQFVMFYAWSLHADYAMQAVDRLLQLVRAHETSGLSARS